MISNNVERICNSVVYWTTTPKREEIFFRATRHLNIKSNKKLSFDCKTRWNFTYLMLHITLIYKINFPRLKQRESQYKYLSFEEDWMLVNWNVVDS